MTERLPSRKAGGIGATAFLPLLIRGGGAMVAQQEAEAGGKAGSRLPHSKNALSVKGLELERVADAEEVVGRGGG
jgi:hypothetical protein